MLQLVSDKIREVLQSEIDLQTEVNKDLIGGFHLFNHSLGVYENPNVISEIGSYLLGTKAKFYTCHCTGITAYEKLKQIMGEYVFYLPVGNEIKI